MQSPSSVAHRHPKILLDLASINIHEKTEMHRETHSQNRPLHSTDLECLSYVIGHWRLHTLASPVSGLTTVVQPPSTTMQLFPPMLSSRGVIGRTLAERYTFLSISSANLLICLQWPDRWQVFPTSAFRSWYVLTQLPHESLDFEKSVGHSGIVKISLRLRPAPTAALEMT